MRFLVDPATVRLDVTGWAFLLFVGVGLPAAALRQHRRHALGVELPTRSRIYVGAIVTHALFLAIVWLVAWDLRISLLPRYHLRAVDGAIALAALTIGLVPLIPRFRLENPQGEERARLIAPRSAREHALFYTLCVSAGFAEELAYRGMLFVLLAALLGGRGTEGGSWGSWWGAALISAAAFGVVHLFQGWKSAGVATLMGLREQLVVGLTGTLALAIAVHMLHDAIAGTAIARAARRTAEASA